MKICTYLERTLSRNFEEIKTRIDLSRKSENEGCIDIWIDDNDILDTIPISPAKLQALRVDGSLIYCLVKGKFYYSFSSLSELLHNNYYNPNFNCDGVK